MQTLQLPHDFTQNSAASLQLYDYKTDSATYNTKLNLNQNVFSFLMAGTKQLISHNTTTSIANNNFILIKSGQCIITQALSDNDYYRSMLFFFDDATLLAFLEKHKIALVNNKPSIAYHVCPYDAYLLTFVESLKQINTYDSDIKRPLLVAKFEELMLYMVHKKGVDFLQNFFSDNNNYSRHFKNVVESNSLNTLNINELAFLCNMSVSTFKRTFEKNYNSTPIRWFQDKRLEHSAFLLKNEKKRPTDLYTQIGFESLSSFTQAFKQKYGTTPKQFQIQN